MNRSNVEEIKARLPIEELVGSYVKLEKAGKSFKAKCPFHNEKTASFFVSPERGGYYCFGCGAKGDIFSFVEQFEGLDFKGALKVLAEKAGVRLVFDQKADSERDRLFAIMEDSAKYFEAQLSAGATKETTRPSATSASHPTAGEASNKPANQSVREALEYVKKRGMADKTRAEFRIGFAPEGWRNLYDYLHGKGYADAVIEKAGLIKRRDSVIPAKAGIQDDTIELSGRTLDSRLHGNDNKGMNGNGFYDRFRGRIIFPLMDTSGRVIAFSGRILKNDDKSAKYLNSPDTPLFDKSSVLYGLDKAKGFIRRLDYSILVEGQMDLIMSHQAGVKNTVAASGTALTDAESDKNGVINNLGLLRRLSQNVIIAFDADAAGRKAAMRAAGIALSLGMDVKVADITGGKDPADLVLANPEDWKNVLRAAKPVVEFELNNVLRETADPRKVPKILRERVFPFICAIESSTDKAYSVKLVADKTNLPESAVWDDMRAVEKKAKAEAGQRSGSERAFGGREGDRDAGASPAGLDAGRSGPAPLPAFSRIDLVERRMFGLLDLMEKGKSPVTAEYRERIIKIAGDSYAERVERIKPLLADASFEAETIYGGEPDRWPIHMDELISNFNEDMVNQELIATMGELRAAERAGDHARVAELAKKCQALSVRKAEVAKGKRGH